MNPLDGSRLLEHLTWRYATKRFDPNRRIDARTWEALEASLILAPSSYGLQPWKFLVVTDPELKAKLRSASWNQAQVTDCSHHVVFLGRTGFGLQDIDRFIARIAEVRGLPREALDTYRGYMIGDLVEGPRAAVVDAWVARQVYIALGVFLTAAAMLGVDTCPMEGLDPNAYDTILGLEGCGYRTLVACSAGYRHAEDPYASLPKVRYPREGLIEHR